VCAGGALALLLYCAAATSADGPKPGELAVKPDTVIATVDGQKFTARDLLKTNADPFQKFDAQYQLKLEQLQKAQEKARYDLLHDQLENYLDQKALQAEAKSRNTTPEAVLADLKTVPVTDEAMHAFYDENKWKLQQTFDELRPDIHRFLTKRGKAEATRQFYDALRAKHGIVLTLAPYRIGIEAAGPVRGKSNAPVTIVEFGDFQCPYCRRAEDTLTEVLAKYPDQVRLVFRNFPLENIHDNAAIAAEAAVCADRQGKFWPMHDAMYQAQTTLTEAGLTQKAQKIGLDMTKFATCRADPAVKSSIAADVQAGDQLNVVGTPYFLINGRPLGGSVPAQQFETVIDDELHRLHVHDKS
jgi:predicted DsbA family dithiol-disulfide isomerase